VTRRDFARLPALWAARAAGPVKLAALVTTYHVRSHADNIVTRLLEGYWINERHYQPPCRVASLYMDQVHPADIGRRLAAAYGFPVVKTIAEALTLGTGKLAVDGVVLIGEHGNYPVNERQQQLYPRYEFFEQVVQVFRDSGRAVPVFCDKHLSYDWTKARRMYDWSRELRFPLMAGSSLPVTFRRPDLDYPLGTRFEDALMVGGGWVGDGGIFHNLETLQCFLERRKGAEKGISAVRHVAGEEVWRVGLDQELAQAALAAGERVAPGRMVDVQNPVACVVEYRDGFRGGILMLPGMVREYLIALRVKGKVRATSCYTPPENSNNFSMLVHGMMEMFTTGKPPYPVERTLLTTGALARIMESGATGHRRIETPELAIAYRAPRESYYSHGRGS